MRNQKGFTGIEIAGILALGFIVIGVVAPIVGVKIPGIGGSSGQTSTQKSSYKETVEPVLTKDGTPMKVETEDGQEAYLFKRARSNDASDEKVIPPAPLVERVLLWFVHLGFAGFLLALAFPAAAVAVWAWVKSRWTKLAEAAAAAKAAHANTVVESKRIVLSVDAGLEVFDKAIAAANSASDTATNMAAATTDPALLASYKTIVETQNAVAKALMAAKNSFLATMSKKQDESTKLFVGQMKNGG